MARAGRALVCLALVWGGLWAGVQGFGAARAEPSVEVRADTGGPAQDAVVSVGPCSGTLIADRVVLTVAHCLPPELRAPRPVGAEAAACAGLEQQAALQRGAWEDPERWYPVSTPGGRAVIVRFGRQSGAPRLTRRAVAYALPRCADMALLRLDLTVPFYVARAQPVLTRPPAAVNRTLGQAALRHAGWGMPTIAEAPAPLRQTGPVRFWAANRCQLAALPPRREGGARILPGDSGSPLLMAQEGQARGGERPAEETADRRMRRGTRGREEIVAGVLFGSGVADRATCGPILPAPPPRHGSYLPTFRPAPPGSGATDLGAWLRAMVPEADHR